MEVEPTVFIVDDDSAMRDAVSKLVQSVGLAVKSYASAKDYLSECDPSAPGCMILDVRMPVMSGLDLQQELEKRNVRLPIIFLTGHGDIPMSVKALKGGAFDFIEKPPNDQKLLDSVHRAIEADRQYRLESVEKEQIGRRLSTLTPREREVMEHLLDGKGDKQVAAELDISPRGAAFHRAHILEKMQVDSLVELVQVIAKLDA